MAVIMLDITIITFSLSVLAGIGVFIKSKMESPKFDISTDEGYKAWLEWFAKNK